MYPGATATIDPSGARRKPMHSPFLRWCSPNDPVTAGVSFATSEGLRFIHRADLYPLFEAAFARKSAAELTPAFDAGGVTWGAYQTLEAALEDPRLFKDNPLFQDIRHPSGLSYPAPGAMATIPQDVRGDVRAAPKLGQHTDEVLAEVVGLSSSEIAKLHDAGIVAGPEGK